MPREQARYQDRIVEDPNIMVGQPVVKGTRIPVEKVLDQLAYEPDLEELFRIYPELTMEDVKACLAYARASVAERLRRSRRAV
jgi:uncharacterized protein (DUF433 family)